MLRPLYTRLLLLLVVLGLSPLYTGLAPSPAAAFDAATDSAAVSHGGAASTAAFRVVAGTAACFLAASIFAVRAAAGTAASTTVWAAATAGTSCWYCCLLYCLGCCWYCRLVLLPPRMIVEWRYLSTQLHLWAVHTSVTSLLAA